MNLTMLYMLGFVWSMRRGGATITNHYSNNSNTHQPIKEKEMDNMMMRNIEPLVFEDEKV
ncbi:hypothetical protein HPULCUR_005909 [Helicostylum pulchrum]|uniref:Uncharacterized protein n=1 Tax=Helicostylum pulchrum TaxID=562976 RepID=A0ABP9Y0E4_9FUNG